MVVWLCGETPRFFTQSTKKVAKNDFPWQECQKSRELYLEGFDEFFVKVDLTDQFFVYQMDCAIWAVDFFAFTYFAEPGATGFVLGATVAVSW